VGGARLFPPISVLQTKHKQKKQIKTPDKKNDQNILWNPSVVCAGSRSHSFWLFSPPETTSILGLLHFAELRAAVLALRRGRSVTFVADGAVFTVLAVGVNGGVHATVQAPLRVLLGQPLALDVRLHPEVGEEHEEEGAVHPDEVDDDGELVVAGVHEVVLRGVEGDQHKLDLENNHKIQQKHPMTKSPWKAVQSIQNTNFWLKRHKKGSHFLPLGGCHNHMACKAL